MVSVHQSLYGLRVAERNWYLYLKKSLNRNNSQKLVVARPLFKNHDDDFINMYVDSITIVSASPRRLNDITR